jgi:hypothetical protein
MSRLPPPRHILTLPISPLLVRAGKVRSEGKTGSGRSLTELSLSAEIGPLCGRKRQGLNHNDHSSIYRVRPISGDIALQLIWSGDGLSLSKRGIETAGNSANPVSIAKTAVTGPATRNSLQVPSGRLAPICDLKPG